MDTHFRRFVVVKGACSGDSPKEGSTQSHIFAGSLESAYSLISGSHRIWGQDLGTSMISRPIYQGNDWWKFSIWNQVIFKMMSFCATLLQLSFCATLLQNDITSHSNVCCDVRASLRRPRPSRYEFLNISILKLSTESVQILGRIFRCFQYLNPLRYYW